MKFIRNHKIFTFYFVTFWLTGLLFYLQMMMFPYMVLSLFLLSPAITALSMIAILSKKQGIINFVRELIPTNTNAIWFAVSIILPIIIVFGGAVIFHLSNGDGLNLSTKTLSFGTIIVIVIGCIGEELGWRAYLLPLLIRKYNNKVLASVILGILWGCWHVGDYGEGIGFLFFVFSTIGMSIILTWLYYRGKKNFLTALLFHTFYNLSGVFLALLPENGIPSVQYRIIFAMVPCGIAILLVLFSPVFTKKERKQ